MCALALADLYRDQRLPSCQTVAVSPCGRRWQQFAGVAPPGKDRRPSPRAGGPATPLTSRRKSRAADANPFASKSCSLSSAFAAKIWMPKRMSSRCRPDFDHQADYGTLSAGDAGCTTRTHEPGDEPVHDRLGQGIKGRRHWSCYTNEST